MSSRRQDVTLCGPKCRLSVTPGTGWNQPGREGPSPPCKRSSTEPSCLRIAQGEGGVLPGQTQPLIVLLSNVTAAVLASALPVRVAAASIVTDAPAIMFPTKALPPPIVAELPTCQ